MTRSAERYAPASDAPAAPSPAPAPEEPRRGLFRRRKR